MNPHKTELNPHKAVEAAGFRALAVQVRAMGLLDRRPGYYGVKIALTVVAYLAGWILFVLAGNSWLMIFNFGG